MKCRVMPLMAICAFSLFAACDKDDDNNNDNSTTVSAADSAFSPMAAMSNYAEISAGRLALTKSSDSGVIAFANKMITDHTLAQDSIKLVASQLGLTAADTVNAEQKAVADRLQTLSGVGFDSVYINSEVTGHVETITLLTNQSTGGTNMRLKDYANRYLPIVQMHKTHANSLAAKYK